MDVLVDELYRDYVGYLAVDARDEKKQHYLDPIGTVFFVALPEIRAGCQFFSIYCVTARHILDVAAPRYLILTRRNPKGIATTIGDWVLAKGTDIAVCRLRNAEIGLRQAVPVLPDSPPIQQSFLNCGRGVFIVGLFSPLPGYGASVDPIVRFGRIALPRTRVHVCLKPVTKRDKLTPVSAHVIETLAWGGESGAPVFAYTAHYRSPYIPSAYPDQQEVFFSGAPQRSEVYASETDSHFIGLLHGHFDDQRPSKHMRRPTEHFADVNAGIAVVIPVEDIMELLMKDERLVKDRERGTGRKPHAPVPDVKRTEQSSFTQRDFEDALRKVSRRLRPSQSDKEKK